MAVEANTAGEFSYIKRFPWLRILRGPSVASDPKKIALATAGLIVLSLGWGVLDRAFPGSAGITPSVWSINASEPPLALPEAVATAPWRITEPARFLIAPFLVVFSTESGAWTFLHALVAACWAAAVWGIFGGAIARMAVIQVALSERTRAFTALKFATRRWGAFIGAPLTPLLGVAVVATPCVLYGLLYRIPGLGPILGGLFLIVPLLLGLVLALIIVGWALGWPLMHATVAAESAEDGFDAISRSYAYIHQRPAQYAAYLALAWVAGAIGFAFVDFFAWLVIQFAHWTISFAAPAELLNDLFSTAPDKAWSTALELHLFWRSLLSLLVRAWTFGYFWTASSIIYLLLRHDVDGALWHEIAGAESPGNSGPQDPDAVPSGSPAPHAPALSAEAATPSEVS